MKGFYTFSFSSIGYSHITANKVCQDYSASFQNDTAAIAVVSDGHGSANFTRSDRGSRFACQVAIEAATEFLEDVLIDDLVDPQKRDEVVLQLCKNIMLRWNKLVDCDGALEPFTEQEVENVSAKYKESYIRGNAIEHAYGATLIIIICTNDFVLAIRNGDGQCVALDGNGHFSTPIPWNENCEFNVTTSLCDTEAIDDFRYWFSTELPAAIFIGSDGVDDSYATEEDLFSLYRAVCLKALDEGVESAARFVEEALPEITRRGSMDDVSIAGILNQAALEKIQVELEIAQNIREIQLESARKDQRKRVILRDIKVAQKQQNRAIQQLKETQNLISRIKLLGHHAAENIQPNGELVQIISQCEDRIVQLMGELESLGGSFERDPAESSMASAIIQAENVQQLQSFLPVALPERENVSNTRVVGEDKTHGGTKTLRPPLKETVADAEGETVPGELPLQLPIEPPISQNSAVPLSENATSAERRGADPIA